MQFKKVTRLFTVLIVGGVFFTGCFDSTVNPESSTSGPKLFLTQSDFESGLFQWMSVTEKKISSPGFSIYSDADVNAYNGYVYIIEHLGADNIIKFDPSTNDQSGIQYQKHIGDNWNPNDIEFVSDTKAYISNMNKPQITIFNPSTAAILDSIDISAYTYLKDSNTTPYATDLQMAGSDLYVMLQRRNGYNPGAPTLILKINTLTNAVVDTIPLKYKNGYAMTYYDGALYVTNPGSLYDVGDGGIEKINLADKVVTDIITETTLGGNPNKIVHKNGSRFYITNYIGWKNVPVMEIDVATGSIVASVPNVKDAFGGIFYDIVDSTLYVGDRDSLEMGVRIFKNNTQVGDVVKSSGSLPSTSLIVLR